MTGQELAFVELVRCLAPGMLQQIGDQIADKAIEPGLPQGLPCRANSALRRWRLQAWDSDPIELDLPENGSHVWTARGVSYIVDAHSFQLFEADGEKLPVLGLQVTHHRQLRLELLRQAEANHRSRPPTVSLVAIPKAGIVGALRSPEEAVRVAKVVQAKGASPQVHVLEIRDSLEQWQLTQGVPSGNAS